MQTREDQRDERETLDFLRTHVAERGAEAETAPFSVEQITDVFLKKLVIDYDYVFCMTITRTRSPIYDNALQASYAILNEYRAGAFGRRPRHAVRVARGRYADAVRRAGHHRGGSRAPGARPAKARRRSARAWKTSRCTPTAS